MALSPGSRVGRYEILARLGAGGMGEVYRALDPRLDRQVAIKVLPQAWANDPDRVARFEIEARATAALNHPHILAIYDIGSHDGFLYLVTELLEGRTLTERVSQRPMAPDEAVALATQIAEGLASAHDRGIVHRDLKPDNILVTKRDRIKILDFGLAKIRVPRDVAGESTMWHTPTGTVLGTFGYMAPEDVRGVGSDHRADLFAFGAVLYEMLTGRRAFQASSSFAAIAAVLEHVVPKPSYLQPEVPGALDRIVGLCLEKDPSVRFQSAHDIVDALTRLDETPRPETAPIESGLTAVPSIAVLPFVDMSAARDQEYFCEGVAEEITNTLARARGIRVIARTSAFRFKGQSRDVREVGRALGATAVLEGSIRTAGSRIRAAIQLVETATGHQMWADRFDRDLVDALSVQDDISNRVAESLSIRLGVETGRGRTSDPEAHTLFLRGRHAWNKRTEADLERSIAYFRQAIARDPFYAHAHAGLADALITLGIYGGRPPAEVVDPARSAASQALALSPQSSGALACLGCIEALYDQSWNTAAGDFRRAIDLNPDDGQLRQWFATNVLVPMGQFDAALSELKRAQALDPLSLPISASIGITHYYARRFDDAAAALGDTCRLEERFALARLFLGYVHAAQHRLVEAKREVETAVQIGGRAPEYLAARGFIASATGDSATARATLDELRGLSASRYVSPVLLAQVHAGLGETTRAIEELERAAAIRAFDLAWIRVRPTFDPLRHEPRFQALVAGR